MTVDNNDHQAPDDEATSAADADWLAALRNEAGSSQRSMADLLTDDEDDELTIDHPGGLESIRSIVAEQRAGEIEVDAGRDPSAAPDTSDSDFERSEMERQDAVDAEAGAVGLSLPLDPGPVGQPARGQAPVNSFATKPPEQRWVAPPRLAATDTTRHEPIGLAQVSRHAPGWLLYAAVAVALAVGFATALFVFGGGNSDEAPPDTTVTVTVTESEGTTP